MNIFPLLIIMKACSEKAVGEQSGISLSSPQIFRRKKNGKKPYLSASLSLRCLSHDKFYSDTLAQNSIFSLPAQRSLNFNETLFPKFTAKMHLSYKCHYQQFYMHFWWRKKKIVGSLLFLFNTWERSLTIWHLSDYSRSLGLDSTFFALVSVKILLSLKIALSNWKWAGVTCMEFLSLLVLILILPFLPGSS